MRARLRRRHLGLGTTALGAMALAAAAAACAVEAERAAFEPDDRTPDATANLPETAAPIDAAKEPEKRDPFDVADEPVACVAGQPCAVELVAGGGHFCARMQDGTVRCWGDDALGSVGEPAKTPSDAGAGDAGSKDAGGDAGASAFRVRTVARLSDVTQLSAGGATTCARRGDGSVLCWGGNQNGELGTGEADFDPHPLPEIVDVGGTSIRVDVGQGSVCALRTTNRLVCWGRDDYAQLARAELDGGPRLAMVREPGAAATEALGFVATRIGRATTLALNSTGEVWSWGALAGNEGVLSGRVSSVSPDALPKRILELEKVTSFAVSTLVEMPEQLPEDPFDPIPPPPPPRAHACAIANGEVYCWGRSYVGALCTGLPDREVRPKKALLQSKAWPQQIAVADEITCVRMTNGSVQCCGTDDRGRLGTGDSVILSSFFVEAKGVTGRAVHVATSDKAACALMKDGSVQCWGSNERAELGTAAPDEEAHPTALRVAF